MTNPFIVTVILYTGFFVPLQSKPSADYSLILNHFQVYFEGI